MSLLRNILDIGTESQAFASANRIRTLNFIVIFSTIVSALYTLCYIFIIEHPLVALLNTLFTLSYLVTLRFHYYRAQRGAKTWFFCVLMLHIFVCTNVYVTNASGFHLYYFLVPTGAFLLFELNEKAEKITLSTIAIFLFFYCQNTVNVTPLITLSSALNQAIYQSVVFVNMLEVVIVMTLFTNEIERNEKKLILQATTDSLTGIANRRYFFEQGEALVNNSNHQQQPLTICLLDFDYFKNINDQYGHCTGDLCLVEVSKLISSFCRPTDLFARIGGEEFVIIMANTQLEEANQRANLIRNTIKAHKVSVIGEKSFNCTVSFGLACNHSSDPESADAGYIDLKTLLNCADKALYQAKLTGRNRVINYNSAVGSS